MRIADLLSRETKEQLHKMRWHKRNRKPRRNFSRKEIVELMGVNRDIYERRKGAIRRKKR